MQGSEMPPLHDLSGAQGPHGPCPARPFPRLKVLCQRGWGRGRKKRLRGSRAWPGKAGAERRKEEEGGKSVGAQGQGTGHARLGRMRKAYILLPLFDEGRGEARRGQQASQKPRA